MKFPSYTQEELSLIKEMWELGAPYWAIQNKMKTLYGKTYSSNNLRAIIYKENIDKRDIYSIMKWREENNIKSKFT